MLSFVASLSVMCGPDGLLAYIGPGAGLELVGAVVAMFVTLGTSTAFVVFYPVRKLLRRRRETPQPVAEEPASNP